MKMQKTPIDLNYVFECRAVHHKTPQKVQIYLLSVTSVVKNDLYFLDNTTFFNKNQDVGFVCPAKDRRNCNDYSK